MWDDRDDDRALPPEPDPIVRARDALLVSLDSLGALLPGDAWALGQRVRYRVEAGRLDEAAATASACGLVDRWRCDALLGLVEHVRGDARAAEVAFRRALAAMPGETRARWLDLDPLLDGDLGRWLEESADSLAAVRRIWTLADPLFLAPGNDRWTGHLSRWAHATSSEGAWSPHQMRWGGDLEEAVVRYGWPVAWERAWPRGGESSGAVVGRDAPGARRFLPPAEALAAPRPDAAPWTWAEPRGHARTAYLPPYLDSLGALDAQWGRFWREGGVAIVAGWTAPAYGLPVRSGLFVERGGALALDVRSRAPPGTPVRLSGLAPWSESAVVSLETWAPGDRKARRLRATLSARPLVAGLLSISDLVLIEGRADPVDLAGVARAIRPTSDVDGDEALAVAFEIYGLAPGSGPIGFQAWVERRDEGLLARPLRWLRLRGPKEEAVVRWEEGAPAAAGPWLKTFRIGLPALEAGLHDAVVQVAAPGRAPLRGRAAFRVRRR